MKKLLSLLLAFILILSMLTACVDTPKEPAVEPDVTTTAEVTTEEVTTTPEVTTEDTTTEVETTTEEITTEATTTEEITTTTEPTTAATTQVTTTQPEWVIEPCNEIRYATADLNVRATPEQSGERISHVDKGDEVTVTGWVDNGWARIKFRDGEYYVNGKYLAAEKPAVTTAATTEATTVTTEKVAAKESPDAMTLVNDMIIGWNLGNTLDCNGKWINKSKTSNFETAWGHPVTTKAMIDKIKELGFNTIRIPVSWGEKTDKNYNIDEAWMDRVQEVVDYAIDNGMYVIINSHHDNDYYYPSVANEKNAKRYMESIWHQIAVRFKDYDYHLIFESMNEPRLANTANEWSFDDNNKDCQEAARIINELNQIFVDVVRAVGGNNSDRCLAVTPYTASPNTAVGKYFKLPKDTVENRLIVSVHAYTPYNLVMGDSNDHVTFGSSQKGDIDWFMRKLKKTFIDNGIPVYIGETGCINKNNPEARHDWAYYYVSQAHKYGMPVIVWENSGDGVGTESYGLFNRRTLEIFEVSLPVYNGLMEAVADFK